MSAKTGDKARFDRLRKAKFARRLKTRELRKLLIPAVAVVPAPAAV